jgi:hypothetical protein
MTREAVKMIVATARIVLRMPENASLKDKRQVTRSLLARLRNTFQVSAAEVDTQDSWRIATLGLAFVTNEVHFADEVMAKVLVFIEGSRLDAEVTGYDTENIFIY